MIQAEAWGCGGKVSCKLDNNGIPEPSFHTFDSFPSVKFLSPSFPAG
jgi:hypothetical protein